jgi:hypothetical protein
MGYEPIALPLRHGACFYAKGEMQWQAFAPFAPSALPRARFPNLERCAPRIRTHKKQGADGLVAEFLVAIEETRVRFPVCAIFLPFFRFCFRSL